MGAQVCPV